MCTHSKELRMRSARPHTFGDVQSMNSWKDRERRVISGVRHGFSLNIPMVSSCFIKKILRSPGDHRKRSTEAAPLWDGSPRRKTRVPLEDDVFLPSCYGKKEKHGETIGDGLFQFRLVYATFS